VETDNQHRVLWIALCIVIGLLSILCIVRSAHHWLIEEHDEAEED
jgi:hypothetical protein